MSRHKSEKLWLTDIRDRIIESRNDSEWYEVMGVHIPGLETINHSSEFYGIEAAYLSEHSHDLYLVSWPDHVINPRFNSDASYQLIMSDKHNRMAWQWAKHNQGFTGTYDEWNLLDDEERQQYEDGAAGIGTV